MKRDVHTEEPILHVSLPIENGDLERIRATLERHGASMRKIRTPDNWWIILFPDGTMKIRDPAYGESAMHKVLFVDGFWFILDQGIMRRDGSYKRPPVLHIDLSGVDKEEAGEEQPGTTP
jgi:hypothetical protein